MVYAKEPLQDPQHVLKYLARYTHRVAISNHRLVALEDGQVTFRYKDYQRGHRLRTLTLDAVEFLRRLMLHVPPHGFHRMRHFGFLANRVRQEKLAQCRTLLGHATPPRAPDEAVDLKAPEVSAGGARGACVRSASTGACNWCRRCIDSRRCGTCRCPCPWTGHLIEEAGEADPARVPDSRPVHAWRGVVRPPSSARRLDRAHEATTKRPSHDP